MIMNKNRILIVICFLIGTLSFSGCKDNLLEEITTLDVQRAFSPTDLTVLVVNKVNAQLTWKAVRNADSYTIELFDNADFTGSPVREVSNVLFNQVPYTISGLSGETTYSVRVKAVTAGIDESKWVTATFATAAEQIFQPVDLAKITATSVTLNWPVGEVATSIVLAPGNIVHAVTSDEVAAGEAIVSGLTGETAYTATLLNGTKVRGTITFTTPLDLGGAIAVNPADDLAALIAAAEGGETFALFPGTYTINADLTIKKSISIKGAKPADKPIIKGLAFKITANAGLTLQDLVFDGTGASDNSIITYSEASDSPYGNLNVGNSEIKNYKRGLVYIGIKVLVESMTYTGNIIHDMAGTGAGFVDFRTTGFAKTFLFENNTVYNITEDNTRDLFRMDDASASFPTITSIITIRTNTFYNALNRAAGRYLYIRLAKHQINFTKNIIAKTDNYYTNQSSTTITTMADNNYFNAPNFYGSTVSSAKNDTGVYTTLDPGFADASKAEFTVSNATLKANGIGDPRWIK